MSAAATVAEAPGSAAPFDLTTVLDHQFDGIAPHEVPPLVNQWRGPTTQQEAEQTLRDLYLRLNWRDGQDNPPPPGLPPATSDQRKAYLADLARRGGGQRDTLQRAMRHAAHVRAYLRRLDHERQQEAEAEAQARIDRLAAAIERYRTEGPSLAVTIRAAGPSEERLAQLAADLTAHAQAERARKLLSGRAMEAGDAARELGLDEPERHDVPSASDDIRELFRGLNPNHWNRRAGG